MDETNTNTNTNAVFCEVDIIAMLQYYNCSKLYVHVFILCQ